jgi:transcriptional regulator with XRE-family HTH domain
MGIPILDNVIGERLRAIRESAGKTQEEIAALARQWGLPWTQGTIATIEDGRRDISLRSELFPFLFALSRPFTDLLPASSNDRVVITDHADVPAKALHDILTTKIDYPVRGYRLKAGKASISTKTYPAKAQLIASDALGAAERKAAAVLGVEPEAIAKAARKLWGRSLPEERDARLTARGATPRTTQALRGHATRELLSELRKAVTP